MYGRFHLYPVGKMFLLWSNLGPNYHDQSHYTIAEFSMCIHTQPGANVKYLDLFQPHLITG